MEAAAIVQNKNKCALVSWHPSICSTTQTNGIFPDFLVILIGIRAEDGENLVFAFLTFRLYFSLYNHPFLEILFFDCKEGLSSHHSLPSLPSPPNQFCRPPDKKFSPYTYSVSPWIMRIAIVPFFAVEVNFCVQVSIFSQNNHTLFTSLEFFLSFFQSNLLFFESVH